MSENQLAAGDTGSVRDTAARVQSSSDTAQASERLTATRSVQDTAKASDRAARVHESLDTATATETSAVTLPVADAARAAEQTSITRLLAETAEASEASAKHMLASDTLLSWDRSASMPTSLLTEQDLARPDASIQAYASALADAVNRLPRVKTGDFVESSQVNTVTDAIENGARVVLLAAHWLVSRGVGGSAWLRDRLAELEERSQRIPRVRSGDIVDPETWNRQVEALDTLLGLAEYMCWAIQRRTGSDTARAYEEVTSRPPWTHFAGSPRRLGYRPYSSAAVAIYETAAGAARAAMVAPSGVVWEIDGINTGTDTPLEPVHDNRRIIIPVYTAPPAPGIIAVDPDGQVIYRVNVHADILATEPVITPDGAIVFATEATLHKVNMDGEIEWELVLPYALGVDTAQPHPYIVATVDGVYLSAYTDRVVWLRVGLDGALACAFVPRYAYSCMLGRCGVKFSIVVSDERRGVQTLENVRSIFQDELTRDCVYSQNCYTLFYTVLHPEGYTTYNTSFGISPQVYMGSVVAFAAFNTGDGTIGYPADAVAVVGNGYEYGDCSTVCIVERTLYGKELAWWVYPLPPAYDGVWLYVEDTVYDDRCNIVYRFDTGSVVTTAARVSSWIAIGHEGGLLFGSRGGEVIADVGVNGRVLWVSLF